MRDISRAGLALIALVGAGCAGTQYHIRGGDVSSQIKCEFRDTDGKITEDLMRVASDECYLGPARIYETKYGDDGPGNEDDTRIYYIYETVSIRTYRTEEIDTSKWKRVMPGYKVSAGFGYGNCRPLEKCTEEADRKYSDFWDFE